MSSARQAPSPQRRRNASHEKPRSWYGRKRPLNPVGAPSSSKGVRPSSCASSSAIHPSARTPSKSMPPLTGIALRAIWIRSRKRILRLACFFRRAMAASISSALNWTHCPRILTSGALSRARCSSSFSVSGVSPRAISQSKRSSASRVEAACALHLWALHTTRARPVAAWCPCRSTMPAT